MPPAGSCILLLTCDVTLDRAFRVSGARIPTVPFWLHRLPGAWHPAGKAQHADRHSNLGAGVVSLGEGGHMMADEAPASGGKKRDEGQRIEAVVSLRGARAIARP